MLMNFAEKICFKLPDKRIRILCWKNQRTRISAALAVVYKVRVIRIRITNLRSPSPSPTSRGSAASGHSQVCGLFTGVKRLLISYKNLADFRIRKCFHQYKNNFQSNDYNRRRPIQNIHFISCFRIHFLNEYFYLNGQKGKNYVIFLPIQK